MKGKFHISPKTGAPGKCSAQVKECPFEHFDSLEEANASIVQAAEKEFGTRLPNFSKPAEKDPFVARIEKEEPINFDTELSEVYYSLNRQNAETQKYVRYLRDYVDLPRRYQEYSMKEILDAGYLKVTTPINEENRYRQEHTLKQAQKYLTLIEESMETEKKLQEKMRTYDRVYNERGRWPRAFLVEGGNGHVHSSMDCSTCNKGAKPTSFSWMTQYSGKNQDEIVSAAGWRACTVCYPNAPVGDPTTLPSAMLSKDDIKRQEEREARQAAKNERLKKAIANGLTEDGSPFAVLTDTYSNPRTEEFKTERAAKQWAVRALSDHRWSAKFSIQDGRDIEFKPNNKVAVEKIISAIAKKHNRDFDDVKKEIMTNVYKKDKDLGIDETMNVPDLI